MTLREAEYNLKWPEGSVWSPSVDRSLPPPPLEMATPLPSIFALLLFLHFSNSLPFLRRKADTGSTNAKLDNIQQNIVILEQNDRVPECIHNIEPKFRLLTRNSEAIEKLAHLVILIHGFNSWPSVWANDLAKSILEGDTERKDFGVLVVDWEKGARYKTSGEIPPSKRTIR